MAGMAFFRGTIERMMIERGLPPDAIEPVEPIIELAETLIERSETLIEREKEIMKFGRAVVRQYDSIEKAMKELEELEGDKESATNRSALRMMWVLWWLLACCNIEISVVLVCIVGLWLLETVFFVYLPDYVVMCLLPLSHLLVSSIQTLVTSFKFLIF